jgi:DNA-binding NtrC family response regulator
VERAAILAEDGETLDVTHLPEELARVALSTGAGAADPLGGAAPSSLHAAVTAFERALIIRELERDGWNRTQTAKRLRISRRAFMEKLRRYQIRETDE